MTSIVRRTKILWFNYQLMRLFGNGKLSSLHKGLHMCQGKKVKVHPGRRKEDA